MTLLATATRRTRCLSSPLVSCRPTLRNPSPHAAAHCAPMRVGSLSKNPAPVTEYMLHKAQHVEFRNFTHLLSIRQVELDWHATPVSHLCLQLVPTCSHLRIAAVYDRQHPQPTMFWHGALQRFAALSSDQLGRSLYVALSSFGGALPERVTK